MKNAHISIFFSQTIVSADNCLDEPEYEIRVKIEV